MKTANLMVASVLSAAILGVTAPALAIDLDAMKKKSDEVKTQAENVKKEGTQTKADVKDMKVNEATKSAGRTKDETIKLKDTITGK
jgi:hypothetical protein